MNPTDDKVLDDELAAYLRRHGVPHLVARAAMWLTRAVRREQTYTLSADASRLHAALVAWFAHHAPGRLVRAEERRGTFEVQGVVLVAGSALGSSSPKLVLANVSIEPNTAGRAHVTIKTSAKVGRLSIRAVERAATAACEAVARDIVEQLSAASPEPV